MLPISAVRWHSKAAKCSEGRLTLEVSPPSTLSFIFYDKLCGVDMNTHATCISCVDHLCGDLLSRITVLR